MSASAVRLKHFGWGREGEGLNADEDALPLELTLPMRPDQTSASPRADIYQRGDQALHAHSPMPRSDPIFPRGHSNSLCSQDRVYRAPFACIRLRVCEILPP